MDEQLFRQLLDQQEEIIGRMERLEKLLCSSVERESYTTAQAGARLNRTEWTVRQWCNRGQVPGARKVPGRGHGEWRIPAVVLARLEREGPSPLIQKAA